MWTRRVAGWGWAARWAGRPAGSGTSRWRQQAGRPRPPGTWLPGWPSPYSGCRAHAFWSANLTTRRLVGPTCRPLNAWMAVWACGGGEGEGSAERHVRWHAGRVVRSTVTRGAVCGQHQPACPSAPRSQWPSWHKPAAPLTCWREAYVRKAHPLERPCERRMASSKISPTGANRAHRSCSIACGGRGSAQGARLGASR